MLRFFYQKSLLKSFFGPSLGQTTLADPIWGNGCVVFPATKPASASPENGPSFTTEGNRNVSIKKPIDFSEAWINKALASWLTEMYLETGFASMIHALLRVVLLLDP